ncbi:class I SAM-dependent methyltransferase [Beggiatoa leptomitoformis]|uniref:Methyltransferase domain-containing protein n=1 Tax=Beggiatoa leptomitoformis TaxID=288004 RepID=A0A2N9YHM1_9GAMM|nr:methyltransferase domain-containing protein [Beggiatoa leptomitoformis]ALG67843.1 methyltransferase domain-containing protein [Beggiatoa leptomitoformis]AUI69899.1 methyltransferase domain-containing protein [Beggiatoa leptomitoformis]
MTSATEWNNRYLSIINSPSPCEILSSHAYLLPTTGKSLDIASGLGANALFLAQHGLDSHAWDYSDVALAKLQLIAQQQQLTVHTALRDVVSHPPETETFDVILVAHFLERAITEDLIHALKPNGLLFYQTFTRCCVTDTGPKNPTYRLAENELLQLFNSLQIIFYREEGQLGDVHQGFRDKAQLIARRVK